MEEGKPKARGGGERSESETAPEGCKGESMESEWKLAMTFRLPARLSGEPHQYKHLKTFMQELMTAESILVAYIGWYVPSPSPHIHLCLSYISKDGTPPPAISFPAWEARWNQIIRYRDGGLEIKQIFDSKGWQDYVVNHSSHPDSIGFFFNREQLKKQNLGG